MAVGLLAALSAGSAVAADSASGTIAYQSKSGPLQVNVTHVYLVQGPDATTGKTTRKLIFSASDLGGKIKSCQTMSCPDGSLDAGMTVDIDVGSRLNYWFAGNDQRVQYSGTTRRDALVLTTDSPQRVAGKLAIDDSAAGGVKASLSFDAALSKQYPK